MYTKRIAPFLLALASLVPAAALADEPFAVTPSGATEVFFDRPARATLGALANRCMDTRWPVVAQTETQLTCNFPMTSGQSLMGQLLLGNSYSTPPVRLVRFTVVDSDSGSRVQAQGWIELQMAFGQIRRTDLTGPEFHNGMTGWLMQSGGRLPPGTRFPNHAFLGVDGPLVPSGRHMSLRVDGLRAGGAAERAGIQPGDLINRIAGQRFRHDEDYLDATAEAAEQPRYRVELTRAGRAMTLELDRTFRPDVAPSASPAQ